VVGAARIDSAGVARRSGIVPENRCRTAKSIMLERRSPTGTIIRSPLTPVVNRAIDQRFGKTFL
jgi:hypothetical protein